MLKKITHRREYDLVTQASKLGKASSFFFFSGFVISKIQYLPVAIVSSALTLLSLGMYFIGYALWFISSHFHPDQKIANEEWYSFAQFKEQFLYASILGLIGTLLSITAIFFPVVLVPAAWLYVGSNILWAIGEFHKLNNPPVDDENFNYEKQNNYLSYALTMTTIALIAATATTLVYFFPPIALTVILTSSIICVGLGLLAAEHWLNSNFGDYKKDPDTGVKNHNTSYKSMSRNLQNSEKKTLPVATAPYHGEHPLASKPDEKIKFAEQPEPIQQESPNPTCAIC